MAHNSIHFFTVKGKETSEGAVDSVVQYDEATATRMGLKFSAVKDEPGEDPAAVHKEQMRLASLDGSESTGKSKALSTDDVEDEPAEAEEVKPASKRTAKK